MAGRMSSFARQLRLAGLRPHCEACSGVTGRETIEIGHPAGEEIQWDWFERRSAPWAGDGVCAAGHAVAFGPDPRGAGRVAWTRRTWSRRWTR